MTPHHVKVVQLTEDYAKLTRDDRARYEQIVWALRGEMRRLPTEVGFNVPLVMMLLGGGQREQALEHAKICVAALKKTTMLAFLVTILIGELTALGQFDDATTLLLAQLRAKLPDAELAKVHHKMLDLALRSGSVELLHRCAQAGVGPVPQAQKILERLRHGDLLEWLGKQQRALEPILGPVTTGFTVGLIVDEAGAVRIVLTYYTCAPTPNLRALGDRVFAALHDVYETHPRGPAAFLGYVVVDVRGPQFAEVEPADRARSEIVGGLGTQALWRAVRRFADGRAIDPGLRRGWTIGRAFLAALHHAMAAAPAVGIPLHGEGGPYDQLIRAIVGSFNREWRSLGYRLERLRCAAIVADFSPGQLASATDVAEALDLAATILGDFIDEPEVAPAPAPATVAAREPVVVDAKPSKPGKAEKPAPAPAPVTREAVAAMLFKLDEDVMLELLEQQFVTLNESNPELERAVRRVFKLARGARKDAARR
jgi:hypothetical protein